MWILNTWQDLVLFVATPVLIIPLVFLLQSDLMGVDVATLSVLVAGFGAMGHHLPGMIRAYGDRELFERFKWRFIVAPLFLLAVCIPLAWNNLSGMLLILLLWGYWHGLMQVYGFVRIYDVKVGSTAATTAYLDWLMCLCWFSGGMIFSDGRMAHLLDTLYTGGGPLIAPQYIQTLRVLCAAVTGVVTVCFLVNFAWQWGGTQRPNPNKLLMLASGIGFWWFAMVYVRDILLGIAMFEIFHDVQYLAIVWLYNRRRVEKASGMGAFMRFLFRRSTAMLLLYVGLVLAYGGIRIVSDAVPLDGVKKTLIGLIWASTILHFYYDGFIWKVREQTLREGLGLAGGRSAAQSPGLLSGELVHGLKWSPFLILVCWLSMSELRFSYPPPPGTTQRLWSNETYIEWNENITAVVPNYAVGHARLASMLDNLGRTDEAKQRLRLALERDPSFSGGHLLLGRIHHRLGELAAAAECYRQTIQHGKNETELIEAHFRLGEVHHQQGHLEQAERAYRQALRLYPQLAPAEAALRRLRQQNVKTE